MDNPLPPLTMSEQEKIKARDIRFCGDSNVITRHGYRNTWFTRFVCKLIGHKESPEFKKYGRMPEGWLKPSSQYYQDGFRCNRCGAKFDDFLNPTPSPH